MLGSAAGSALRAGRGHLLLHNKLSIVSRSHLQPTSQPQGKYSTFQCAGNGKRVVEPLGRVCIFHDLCSTGLMPGAVHSFYKQNMSHPILFDENEGYLTEFKADNNLVHLTPRPLDYEVNDRIVPFMPKVVNRPLPERHISAKGIHILWEKRIGMLCAQPSSLHICFTRDQAGLQS